MGDAADDCTDAGLDAWVAHQLGCCDVDSPCPYCDDDAAEVGGGRG